MPGASDAGETRRDCRQVHALLWCSLQAGVHLGVAGFGWVVGALSSLRFEGREAMKRLKCWQLLLLCSFWRSWFSCLTVRPKMTQEWLYREEFEQYEKEGVLQMHTAFSREQAE